MFKSILQLTLEGAKLAAAAAAETAKHNGWNVVIAILDAGGHLLYLERMDGTQLGSVEVAQQKGRTALLFKRSTQVLEEVVGKRPVMMTLPGATPIEGGVPLIREGQVIGAVGISGVQSSEDGQIAKAAADFILSA